MKSANLSLLKNQKGFTLLELMFALGILVVGVYLVVEGINQMEVLNKDTKVLSATERQINMIVDNIRTGLSSYQIAYDYKADVKASLLDIKNLPMAWGPGIEMPVSQCNPQPEKCTLGRYGYIVQPLETKRGLYQVTLRMTHPDWRDPYRDYEFLVTVQ